MITCCADMVCILFFPTKDYNETEEKETEEKETEETDDSKYIVMFGSPRSTHEILTKFKAAIEKNEGTEDRLFYLVFQMENEDIEDKQAIGINKRTLKFIYP